MKALTERQPYASLIAAGVKTIITRARPVDYRGRVAIHAGQRPYTRDEVPVTDAERTVEQRYGWPLPLGAVVASAVITDCAPIGGPYDFRTGYVEGDEGDFPGQPVVVYHPDYGHGASLVISNADTSTTDITDQLPFDDFSPGRWALLLDDIAPTTSRCPQCWGDPVYHGLGCDLCDGKGTCDPVPVRGRSGLWEWTR